MSAQLFRRVVLCALPLLLAGCHRSAAPTFHHIDIPVATRLRIDNATIVDTRSGHLTPAMSILMDHGQILAIVPTASVQPDASLRSIDATGKFVTPGYNNMHSHALTQPDPSGPLAIMLTEGTTGFRLMGANPDFLKARREGTLPIGPDSPALLSMPGDVLVPFNAPNVKQAITLVDNLKADGADFIKIGVVSPEVFFAVLAEAKRLGTTAVGHLQEGVDPADAARAGYHSIEHLGTGDTIWDACSTDQSAVTAEALKHPRIKTPPFKLPGFIMGLFSGYAAKMLVNPAAFEEPVNTTRLQHAMDTYDPARCQRLAAVFVAQNTWQCPTLVRLRTQELADDPAYLTDPGLAYIAPEDVVRWKQVTATFNKLSPSQRSTDHAAYQHQLMLTKLFSDAGVPMLVGTDGAGTVPGQSLFQEFAELTKAGLTPLKILQMTTIDAAQFLNRTATMGTVESGKDADLVLLEADPTQNASNLSTIAAVVRAGRYYSRQDLDQIKSRVQQNKGHLD